MGKYVVLDSETGEVTQDLGDNINGTTFIAIHEGEAIYRRSKMFADYVSLRYDYVKINYKACILLYQKCPQFLLLVPFIGYKDNILRFKNGHLATMKGIARRLGYNEDYFKGKFLKRLKDLDIAKVIKHDGHRAIIMNPYVVYKGKEVTREAKELFENSDWALLSKGGYDGSK